MVISLNDQNHEAIIRDAGGAPVLVDFWSPRCGACRYNASIADEISKMFDKKVRVCKVNVEESPYLVGNYGISVVPSMTIFHKGNKIRQFNGITSRDSIAFALKEIL